MTIRKLIFIRQCDMKGCSHVASHVILYDDNNPRTSLFLCNECLENIAKCYKFLTPTKKKTKASENANAQ